MPVLGSAGRKSRLVVRPHAVGGGLVDLAPSLQLGLDLERPLGEGAQLLAGEALHLPAPVSLPAPCDTQVARQEPLQLGLEQRTGGLRPFVKGVGVEGHMGAIGALHDVGDQAVGVKLGVALTGGAVNEGRHREALRRHSSANAPKLLAGECRLLLQEGERNGNRLDVSLGHDVGHLVGAEGPQERHRLGARVGGVEGVGLAGRSAGEQVAAGPGMMAFDEGARSSASTTPSRPRPAAHRPCHTPGASPTPR